MTTGSGDKVAEQKARCAGWRKLSYSANGDTVETIADVRAHNQTGVNKRCWSEKDRPQPFPAPVYKVPHK